MSEAATRSDTTQTEPAKEEGVGIFGTITQALGSVVEAVKETVGLGEGTETAKQEKQEAAKKAVDDAIVQTSEALGGTQETLQEKGAQLADKARETKDYVVEKGQELIQATQEKGQEWTEAAQQKGEEIKEGAQQKGEELKEKASEAAETVQEKGKQAKKAAKQKGEEVKEKAEEATEAAQEKGEEIKEGAKQKGKEMKQEVEEKVDEAKLDIQEEGSLPEAEGKNQKKKKKRQQEQEGKEGEEEKPHLKDPSELPFLAPAEKVGGMRVPHHRPSHLTDADKNKHQIHPENPALDAAAKERALKYDKYDPAESKAIPSTYDRPAPTREKKLDKQDTYIGGYYQRGFDSGGGRSG